MGGRDGEEEGRVEEGGWRKGGWRKGGGGREGGRRVEEGRGGGRVKGGWREVISNVHTQGHTACF